MSLPDRPVARRQLPSAGVLLKVAVGAVLFYVIARYVDIAEALRQIGRADPGWFLAATALILAQHVFAAMRWCAVARAMGCHLAFGQALTGYVEANFFNQALPSTIGGDTARIWRATRAGLGVGPATVSVIVDRAFGLLALALLASFGAYALWRTPDGEQVGLVLGAAIAAIVAAAVLGGALSQVWPGLQNWRLGRPLFAISQAVAQVARKPGLALLVCTTSLISHLMTVVAFDWLALSLGLNLGLEGALQALPALLLAAAVPLSISGWGIREGVSLIVLGLLGQTPNDALALSLLLGLSLLSLGLIGGFVWLLSGTDRVATAGISGHGASEHMAAQAYPPNSATGNTTAMAILEGQLHADRIDSGEPQTSRMSDRKRAILANADASADTRDAWIARNPAYFGDDRRYMRFLIPEGARILDLGCATGELLAALKPSHGVGVDLSPKMIERARTNHPHLQFAIGDAEDPELISTIEGPFDYIIMSDTIGLLDDIESGLGLLHRLCGPDTRLVIGYYSHLWEPAIYLAEHLGFRKPQPSANFLSTTDFRNLLDLADFEPIREERRQIIPKSLLGIGPFINRYIGTLPFIRALCLRRYVVARSLRAVKPQELSVSVLIPCRNERGNIEPAIQRMPRFGSHQEIVFIEGNSNDDTYAEALRVKEAYAGQWDIKVVKQDGRGKGDAMRKGYATATGDVLMILDADLSVPPEMMPRFYNAIASGKGDFINGSRLIYPMQSDAMRPLNFIANRIFAWLFTYLLNQRFTDTLCGTKVFRRRAYDRISAGRSYFGDFDPFGDFDLIFGATKQNLRIVEVPVHYKARTYGETQISRFRDGFLLLRMVLFAWRKLKAI